MADFVILIGWCGLICGGLFMLGGIADGVHWLFARMNGSDGL